MFAVLRTIQLGIATIVLFPVILTTGLVYAQLTLSRRGKVGVLLEHPDMKDVVIARDIHCGPPEEGHLQFDIYTPRTLSADNLYGCIFFLTVMNKDRSWKVYQSWPALAGAYSLIGIAVDVDKVSNGLLNS